MKKIVYISGTRADYGLMKNTLKEIKKEFDLSLIVVGIHLLPEFGYTVKEIVKDGFKIAKKIKTLSDKDTGEAMAESFGLSVIGISQALEKIKPDLVLILGDRGEALAGAIAAVHLNIPVAHIHGGDQGDGGAHIDDLIRHSITKFAHIHLPATKKSAERIIKMGEEPWRVHTVGSPALDEIFSQDFYSKEYLENKYNLDLKKPLILAIQHAVIIQVNEAGKQIRETLEAFKELSEQTILIYPNADAGGRRMIEVIKKYEKYNFLKTYKSLPRRDYLSLMKYASVVVGNSSSGTIDASALKIPVVNIGVRESTREHSGNKIFVGHNKNDIKVAIQKAIYDDAFKKFVQTCKSPYGDGKTSCKIVEVLKSVFDIDREKLFTKKLTY